MNMYIVLTVAVIGCCLVVGSTIMRIHNLPKHNSILALGVALTISSVLALI